MFVSTVNDPFHPYPLFSEECPFHRLPSNLQGYFQKVIYHFADQKMNFKQIACLYLVLHVSSLMVMPHILVGRSMDEDQRRVANKQQFQGEYRRQLPSADINFQARTGGSGNNYNGCRKPPLPPPCMRQLCAEFAMTQDTVPPKVPEGNMIQ